jgi:hypothetical protein
MQKNCALLLILCITVLIFIHGTELDAAQQGQNQYRRYLKQGIEKAFNLEPLAAKAYLQKAVALDRDNPIGYALLALTHLFAYEMSYDEKMREYNQQSMLYYVNETLTRGENAVRNSSQNGTTYLSMSLAKIAKIRWAVTQNAFLVAGQETLNMWDYVEKAKEEPLDYDIYFPR